jgi:hypothetical protein
MEEKKIICPLQSAGNAESYTYCVGQECAWNDEGLCVMKRIANSLERIAYRVGGGDHAPL